MKSSRALTATAFACLSGASLAETPQDTYWGELSYFYPTITSTARLDVTGTRRPGSSISLEDELDLADRKGTPYVSLGMRLGEAWRIEFEYYRLDRSASHSIGRTIDWGDVTFPVGVRLDSTFNTSVYRLTGGYSFYRTPQGEAGAALGLHVTEFKSALSGQGLGPTGAGFQREARDTLVPLPTLGLYGGWMFTPQFQLRGRIDYLTLQYDEYDGSLINALVSVDWRFAKNWGVGVGYRYVDYKLEATSSKWTGDINYKFRGPTLFVNAGF